jgi:hypothetical protein
LEEVAIMGESHAKMDLRAADPHHQAMRRLAERLQQVNIPYATVGSMAVDLHGARRLKDDVEVLLTRQGLDQFCNVFLGNAYEQVKGRKRWFVDHQGGVLVEVRVTGHYPGRSGRGPFPYPDPTEASEEIDGLRVVTLPNLIQLKLASRRYSDLADVVSLIAGHRLDESFLKNLHPAVHGDFIKCLEENLREEEFEARRC